MRPIRRLRVAALLAALAASVMTLPAPAAAESLDFTDPAGDTGHPADVLRVHLEAGNRIVVVVHHDNLTFRDGPRQIRVAYDTSARDAGPEFYLRVDYQTDSAPELRPTRGWGGMHAPALESCTGEHFRARPLLDRTRISVPAGCFGDPHRVRVHVRVAPFHDDDRRVDVAPAARTMGPWATVEPSEQ